MTPVAPVREEYGQETTAVLTGTIERTAERPWHTPEELRQDPHYVLWTRVRQGDPAARDQAVEQYAPLVKYVIGRMGVTGLPSSMDMDDVLSAGTIGLLHAVDRYDPDQGVRFETYALARIRGAIVDTIRSVGPMSRGALQRARAVDETTASLTQRLGRTPSRAELAQELGLTPDALGRQLQELGWVFLSLDSTGDDSDGNQQTLADQVADTVTPSALEHMEERELVQQLADAIGRLRERDQLVLSLYYEEELTLKEISRVLGVSESRVSQLHTMAVLRLRTLLAEKE